MDDFSERFWSKVDKSGSCWTISLFHDKHGYARVMVQKRNRLATHVAWELTHKACLIPGTVVRHSCDNPGCVNPAHLTPGTQAENLRERNERNRQAKGSRNGRAKIKEADVLEIRKLEGVASARELAVRYGLDPSVIYDIWNKVTWRHV